jgi:hypothetical protein
VGVRVRSSWPLHRCVQADSEVPGLQERRSSDRRFGTSVSCSCCSQSREGNLAWQGDCFLVGVESSIGVPGLCRWLQKSVRGIGLREAIPVVAGAGDGGLAHGGFHRKAKGCRDSGEPETASPTKGLRRVTCWWKAFGAAETSSLHGLLVEPVLARRDGACANLMATRMSELRRSRIRWQLQAAPDS